MRLHVKFRKYEIEIDMEQLVARPIDDPAKMKEYAFNNLREAQFSDRTNGWLRYTTSSNEDAFINLRQAYHIRIIK